MPRPTSPTRAAHPPRRARRARVAVAVLFAANGAILAGTVTRYPDIKEQLGLSNTALGTAVGAYWVGALVVGAAAGALVVRFGSARVAWLATVVAGLTLVAVGAAPTWLALVAVLLLAGSADAVADVAENAQGLQAERMHPRPILNFLHAMWSIGAVGGGLVGAAAAGAGGWGSSPSRARRPPAGCWPTAWSPGSATSPAPGWGQGPQAWPWGARCSSRTRSSRSSRSGSSAWGSGRSSPARCGPPTPCRGCDRGRA